MRGLFKEVRSHLGLLLVLAVALGGLFFLFELFGGLTSDGPRDLLTTKDAADSAASEIPSGAGLIAVVAPAMSILLGLAALLLLKRRFKDSEGRQWTALLPGGVVAVGLLGTGVYLVASMVFGEGLPFGGVDYGEHPVKTEGVAPLGLTLLAAFVVTVGLVAVAKPKLLPIPLLAWLTAALVFGMFGSDAIYGVNLFKHHSVVETTPDYTGAVNVYWRPATGTTEGEGLPSLSGQPAQTTQQDQASGEVDYFNVLIHGSPDEKVEAVSELAGMADPTVIPALIEALGDINEDVRTAAESALVEALGGDDLEVSAAAESALVEALGDPAIGVKDSAEWILSDIGASMTPLESGAALVYIGDQVFWAPGTSASRVSTPDDRPVFEVSGASATGYLRTDAGDEYTGQGWTRTDPVELAYAARTPTRQLVYAVLIEDGDVDILPWEDAGASLLLWPESPAEETSRQRITVSAHEPGRKVPAGALPTTKGAEFFDTDGLYRPFSGTFSTDIEVDEYGWMSGVHRFSEEEMLAAQAYSDPIALGLPENVPERVRLLAEEITAEHESVYEKARALAWHLRDNYEYAFATEDDEALPEGRDAVDWFLFETRKGTCGQFSSAFVVLARSVGIPARVVSGWVISEGVERQTVYADQAHQWAEVAFEGIGWRRFEPTPSNGAPFRATVMEAWEDELDRLGDKLLSNPDLDDRLDTIDELLEYSEIAPGTLTDVSDPLIDALGSDEATEVRAKAAEALGEEGYRNAIDPLISALHEDEAEEVRAEAAKALAKLKGDKVIDALIKALKEDESALVRGL